MSTDIELRYPIGNAADQPLAAEKTFSERVKILHLRDIARLPTLLEHAVQDLDHAQLLVPYRPGGWTIQQVVHHVPDSHIHAYTRFKLALTEDNPTIRPYDEAAWANLSDTAKTPINYSLTLLHALHTRWVELMSNMSEAEWQRTFYHPASERTVSLWTSLGEYAWHGKHHLAHVTSLRRRMGW